MAIGPDQENVCKRITIEHLLSKETIQNRFFS